MSDRITQIVLESHDEQIAISTIEQNASLHELKQKLTKHFGAKF